MKIIKNNINPSLLKKIKEENSMPEEQYNQQMPAFTSIRSLEEKQKIIKDRVLLIGQNLIETKEKNSEEILNLKKDLEILKRDVTRLKEFLETLSGEFSNFAKKSDLDILVKQAKMFQPMEFATKEDLEKLKRK